MPVIFKSSPLRVIVYMPVFGMICAVARVSVRYSVC